MSQIVVRDHVKTDSYEQIAVTSKSDGMEGDLEIVLARSHDRFEYRIRDEETLRALFGDRPILNVDDYGPIVFMNARPGMVGAVVSSFWDLSAQDSWRLYERCDNIRRELMAQPEIDNLVRAFLDEFDAAVSGGEHSSGSSL